MTNPTTAITEDRWLETSMRDALRGDASYLDDAGFTARVMESLPPPVLAAPRWRKPAVAMLWTLAAAGAAVALPGAFLDVAREIYRLVAAHPVSLPQIATTLAAIAVASWSVAAYALRSD
jgi:hypothetical protein